MSERLAVLVAARDEEPRIGRTVERLRAAFPEATIVVADDGSRDETAEAAEAAGATVIRLGRRGKGQALTLAEAQLAPGPLLLCDADLVGDLRPLAESSADLAIAAFAVNAGGGFGLAKRAARELIRLRCGLLTREPLSGQRLLSAAARAQVFPVAAGFGVETRMTVDAVRAGLEVEEVELELEHRPTGRNVSGFAHRGRQLAELVLACGPQGVNHRGLRLPLVGAVVGLAVPVRRPGGRDRPCGRPLERAGAGLPCAPRRRRDDGHPQARRRSRCSRSCGRDRRPAALLVGLSANAINQLDTRPGRALKAFGLGALAARGGRGGPSPWPSSSRLTIFGR